MKTIRIKHYKNPSYPTKLVALENRKLLERNIPKAWNTKEMAGVIAILLAANLAACSGKKPPIKADSPAIVAPVFEHGEGAGAEGCVVMTPPIFMSEQEAMRIISDELARNGLNLSLRNVAFPNIEIPARRVKWNEEKVGDDIIFRRTNEFEMNPGKLNKFKAVAMDPEKKLVVEYITNANFIDVGGPDSRCSSQDFDTKETANFLANQIKEKGKGFYFGVFYDPIAERKDFANPPKVPGCEKISFCNANDENNLRRKQKCDEEYDKMAYEMNKDGIEAARKNLELQVKDFVDWLKAQGVI